MLRRRSFSTNLTFLMSLCITSISGADVKSGTFSIVAYDPATQEIGVAVQSRYFSVGMVVPWAEGGVGAIASQASTNPTLGPRSLALLQKGLAPEEVLRVFAAIDPDWDSRQVGIVDAQGRTATWTGKKCLDWAGGESGEGFVCQGNILAGPAVVANMASAFKDSKGELAERLIKALEAGQAAGGDKRGMQSASLLIVRPSATNPEYRERYLDLRVEDHKEPIKELRRLWQIAEGFHMAGRHMQIAKQYEAMGKPDLARIERERVGDSLKRALDRHEKDAGMLNGLAWECATHDLFLPQALEAAERAVMLEPRNVDIIDTLAEVHFRMGNADKAIEVETRALQIDANSQYLKDQIERFRKKKQ